MIAPSFDDAIERTKFMFVHHIEDTYLSFMSRGTGLLQPLNPPDEIDRDFSLKQQKEEFVGYGMAGS